MRMDLFELSATLRLDTSEYEKALADAEKKGQQASSKLGNVLSSGGKGVAGVAGIAGKGLLGGLTALTKLSAKTFKGIGTLGVKTFTGITKAAGATVSAVAGIGKVALTATGAVTALGAAFAPMVKNAVSAFSSYEQLVGGVETIFKNAAGTVIKNAGNAFKTVGMSANDYMETVTVFANKLIQDLNGDTAKAAEVADMALTDMADNVNKMGISMEAAENAYRGMSMGNFRMLDNLRLGYAGTKEEMKRLLADAEKYEAAQGRTVKYSIDSYADMVQAIHVVQRELGITGTTAEEAQTTIEGSGRAMKAAWQNVLTVLANPRGMKSLPATIKEFSNTFTTYLKNIVPAIRAAVAGLPMLITELAPLIADELPKLISDLVPTLINAGVDVAIALVKGITKTIKKINFGKIFKTALTKVKMAVTDWLDIPADSDFSTIMLEIGKKLRKALTDAKDRIKIKLAQLLGLTDGKGHTATSVDDIDWNLIASTLADKIHGMFETTKITVAQLLGIEPGDATFGNILQGIITRAVKGLKLGNDFLKRLVLGNERYDKLRKEIFPNDPNAFLGWKQVGDELVKDLKEGFKGTELFGGIIDIGIDVLEGAVALVDFGAELVTDFIDALKMRGGDFADMVISVINSVLTRAPEWIKGIATFVSEFISELLKPENLRSIAEGLSAAVDSVVEAAGVIASALVQGLVGVLENPDIFESLLNSLAKLIFQLPAKILDSIAKGIEGFTTNQKGGPLALFGRLFGFLDEKGNIKLPSWLQTALNSIVSAINSVFDIVASFFRWTSGGMFNQTANQTQLTPDGVGIIYGQADPNTDIPMDTSQIVAFFNAQTGGYFGGPDENGRYSVIPSGYMSSKDIDKLTGYDSKGKYTEVDLGEGSKVGVGITAGNADPNMAMALWANSARNLDINTSTAEINAGSVSVNGEGAEPKAIGAWNIPYDNYLANLHRGEMVLTASQARDYREGGGFGIGQALVAEMQGLRNDMQNLKIIVGKKVFGQTVVDYSGKGMSGYLGKAEDRAIAGYGWG